MSFGALGEFCGRVPQEALASFTQGRLVESFNKYPLLLFALRLLRSADQ